MYKEFLEKQFLASRAGSIRKDIYDPKQMTGKTLHEYKECFNKLFACHLQHQIFEQLLIQYFYKGLLTIDKNTVDAIGGGFS